MKISTDPRLPIYGATDYAKSLYVRLYALFREIAQAINGNATDIATKAAQADFEELRANAQWYGKAVSEVFYLRDDLSGTVLPPTNNTNFRFAKLTAGDTYNAGVLTSESVSGTSPTITATAVISLSGSPLNGLTVNLINTERRFLRAGASGTLEDAMVGMHAHYLTNMVNGDFANYDAAGALGGWGIAPTSNNVGTARLVAGSDTDPIRNISVGNETRPRDQGITAYMRVL